MDEYNPLNDNFEQEKEVSNEEYENFFELEQEPEENAFATIELEEPAPQPQKTKKNRTGLKLAVVLVIAVILGSIGGAVLTGFIQNVKDEKPTEEPVTATTEVVEEDENYELSVYQLPDQLPSNDAGKALSPVEVYEQTVNSVVGIKTEVTTNAFGQEAVSASSGTGFVLTEDGYVITNCHVITGADIIQVELFNGESYEAELVGQDSSFDIAVLKIEAEGLTPVTVGNSDELKVGEEVAVIGNPLGELTFTMTTGILSALDREINTDGNPQNMLQTNAAINSGNSGGPMFDMNGNVIGVTTAKYSGTSASGATIEGLGFAIPINTALKVAYDVVDFGYVRDQAYLGVTVSTLDNRTANYYGLPVGPRVEAIVDGSCADESGMKIGDIVVSVNGVETATHPELLAVLKKHKAGETVVIVVYRAGAEVTLSVTLDERPHQDELDAQTEKYQKEQEKQQKEQEDQQQWQQIDPFSYFGDSFGNFDPSNPFGFGN